MTQTVLVLGLGVSGKASAAFLRTLGAHVIGADKRVDSLRVDPQIISLGIEIISDSAPLPQIDQLVLSPGIVSTHPLVLEAKRRGIEVVGEALLALRHIRNRCVAITGSNGKTTTSLLLTHLLNEAGMKARALGNIGSSLSEYLQHVDEDEILVIELSSFQLETLQIPIFEAALILNITPNHLNWHPDMDAYARAKARLKGCLKEGGTLFVSNQVAREFGSLFDAFQIFDQESIAMNSDVGYIKRGLPEPQNVQAAFAFCRHFGLDMEGLTKSVETFRKPHHRIEWVRNLREVAYFNDSKASNIHAVIHAVNLFQAPLILIAGGVHKGSSYALWKEIFQGKVKRIVAFGEASEQMERELASSFPFSRVSTLEEAVNEAKKEAKEDDIVLLSPGCSSYDQFRSFEHRGDEFKRMVRGLK